jgi:peptidoglycan/LPS O-acetylase OafA/YrhL
LDRTLALDGLRALAALAVVAFHTRLPIAGGGFLGVDIFFVLSGFLITTLLVRELDHTDRIELGRFWARRLRRLLPALLLMLGGVAIAAPVFFPDADLAVELLWSGLYLSDYSQVLWGTPKVTGHTWSLAVEMQFYLAWPLVVIGVYRHARQRALTIFVALFVLATAWRMAAFYEWGWIRAYYPLDTRLSGLMLGAAIATLKWRPSPATTDWLALSALLVLAVAAFRFPFYAAPASTWGGAIVELSAAALILCFLTGQGRVATIFASPLIARLGLWSYGIYLWHYPIARLTRDQFEAPVAFAITLTLSTVLAGLSYELVERVIQKPRLTRPA